MLSRIPEDILNSAIRKNQNSLQKVIHLYHSGRLTVEECRSTCKEILYKTITAEHNDQVPNAILKPLPEGLIIPDIHVGHFPTDLVIGWNIWSDGSDILEKALRDKIPAVLIDHHGLKTCVELIQGPKPDKPSGKTEGYTEYIGIGTIEGYTSDRPREIKITVSSGGQIRCLFANRDHDDIEAFKRFPLWKEYHREIQELMDEEDQMVNRLIKGCCFSQ